MMMTTAQTTAATDTILAIDLGKYKSVACLSPAINEQRFVKFSTCRAELTKLLDKHRPDVVLIEACLLSGWVHDLCVSLEPKRPVPCCGVPGDGAGTGPSCSNTTAPGSFTLTIKTSYLVASAAPASAA